ncbi:MarR family winged helix-turn-helix transcriptional regulator [Solidesulfovibrio sp.]|uniref:MarR family winged helix-turn-helix transcriptional regulator n=1 Tax=Solidesulfovibrio sp. TaxID=2910990 RepID=UPI0026029FAF|nr:MarR family winged helix-turn-helix transcriptional regulator [Solidesulfovibrio sp.]
MNEHGEARELTQQERRHFSQMLDKLHQCCSDSHASLAEQCGIPQAELRCLTLFGQERYLTAKGIAASLGIARSRVTKLVSGLAEKNLLVRVADPADSRVVLLALTPAGQKLRQEIADRQRALRDAVLAAIAPDRRHMVLQSLDLLKAAMERVGEASA